MHKKILTVLSVIACLLLTKSNANDIEPSKEFYTAINKGAAAMVIDGTLGEWTGVPVLSDPRFAIPKGAGPGGQPGDVASPNYVLWESLGGSWSGPDDQTSAVEVVWDANNVYLGFIVTDDYHENQSGNAWNGDSVQLMISTEAGRSAAPAPGGNYFLYNFALLGVEADAAEVRVEKETPPTGVDPDVEAVVRRDVAGKKTYYEIRLSAAALNLTPPLTAGLKFGLGMAINDGDELQPGQQGWGGLGAHSIVFGKHPSETALVTLSSQTPGADVIFLSAVAPSITSFTFRVNDKGASISDPNSVKLTINGQVVTTTKTAKANGVFDVTYTPAAPFAPGSQNTYAIEVKDTAGATVTDAGSFTTPQYTLLTAADKVTPGTDRGFVFTVHQNSAFTANTYARAAAQLAGSLGPNLADPAAQGPALAPATPNTEANTNKPYTFEIASVINMNIDLATPLGNDLNDTAVPGLPGLDLAGTGVGLNDGIAADILTFVELTAGMHTIIVNSDDGFKTFTGKINDVFDRNTAGQFDDPGGRGAADTAFQVYAPETGVYALRTVWHQGGGGGNIEILEQLANGTKVLLNDDVAGGPKTYRSATGASLTGTAVTSVTPADGATGVNGAAPITVTITEGADTVDLPSAQLRINNTLVTAPATRSGNVVTISHTPTVPLAAGTIHNASVTFTAGGVARTENWSFKTTLFGPGTLFIEAEDFNFEHGKWDEVNAIGMTGAYPGGTYQDKGDGLDNAACVGTDHGIDYSDNLNSDQAIYRPGTPVEAGKRNGPAGLNRGTFNVEVNHVIGWTGTAEWMNYTRMFPAIGPANPGTYNVYARMAHGDAAARRGGILMTVQGDPTLCAADSQTTTELGRFSGPWTGGWDTWPDAGTPQDAILPMNDQAGSKVIVKLAGKQTLRFQFAEGSGDIDFLAFVPVNEPIPPAVVSLSPSPNAAGLGARPGLNATIENRDLKVTAVSVKLDGVDVTETVNITATGGTVSFTPSADFVAGSSHTYTLSITDDRGGTRETAVPFSISFHPFPAGTLFIEAEDFNFEHGKYDTANPIGMTGPYPGGTYQGKGDGLDGAYCDGTDFGIDYNDNNSTSDQAIYRPTTPVEAGKRNGPAGLNRQLFNVQVNHVIGWTGSTEWMNFTRDFPAGDKFYKVMIRMAHGDVNANRGGILSRLVSGDPTLCDDQQVFEELGTVSGPWTGGWDTWPDAGTPQDALMMMKDASGSDAIVKLGGKQTIRFQYAEGAGDIDYIAFLPQLVTGLEPLITSLSPANNSSGISINGGTLTATIQDRDFIVGNVSLTLDGAAVTPTVTKAGNVTTVSFTPTAAFAAGSNHKYVLTVPSNSGNPAQVAEVNFRTTFTPLPAGTLFIEAEDFNFGHGQTITGTPIGMTGPYDGGAFAGRGDGLNGAACDGSDFGIDYMENNAVNDAAVYRPLTSVEAGKTNGPAGFNRGTFNVKVNHVVGWTSSAEWMNYTRDFPATPTAYKVYARMAHGDGAAGVLRGGVLWKVSGDITLCADPNQTTEQLGTFQAPWTGGWDTFPDAGTPQDALMPMKDANGNVATVTLGGKTTLRFQYADAAGDIDYLAFVPAGPVGDGFTGITRNANGSITVTWTGGGVLESTPALTPGGTWTPVTGATSPFTFTPQAGVNMLFARVRYPAP